MKEFQIFNERLKKKTPAIDFVNTKVISYSQFTNFMTCPKRWELNYVHKIKDDTPSIHLVFGTAFHETLQYLIYLIYKVSVKTANTFDYKTFLAQRMREEYLKLKTAWNDKDFSNSFELKEFVRDGIEILNYFIKKRAIYFSTKGYELIGIEVPLFCNIIAGTERNLNFLGYIDIVLYDKRDGTYILYDIKTSTKGWNQYKKKDALTASQLVLYKKFFSEQYNIDINLIKIQYLIVRRKIDTNSEWPQKRIQEFVPANGSTTLNRVTKELTNFVTHCYNTETGAIRTESKYIALKGENENNCRFCLFKNRYDLCPKENRL